jgi:hypothetical protein
VTEHVHDRPGWHPGGEHERRAAVAEIVQPEPRLASRPRPQACTAPVRRQPPGREPARAHPLLPARRTAEREGASMSLPAQMTNRWQHRDEPGTGRAPSTGTF